MGSADTTAAVDTIAEDCENNGSGAAMVSMIICMIILTIFFIFFCLIPVYRLLERRWRHWDLVENDPRWNVDTFQFSPSAAATKHSRQNSYRQQPAPAYTLSEDVEAAGVSMLAEPPSYSQLYQHGGRQDHDNSDDGSESSLGEPPPYKSVESGVDRLGM